MRGWWHDLVVGLRAHRKTPLATLVVVLTLAFAMAANAAAFALLNGLFLRPLPVDRPDRLGQRRDGRTVVLTDDG